MYLERSHYLLLFKKIVNKLIGEDDTLFHQGDVFFIALDADADESVLLHLVEEDEVAPREIVTLTMRLTLPVVFGLLRLQLLCIVNRSLVTHERLRLRALDLDGSDRLAIRIKHHTVRAVAVVLAM